MRVSYAHAAMLPLYIGAYILPSLFRKRILTMILSRDCGGRNDTDGAIIYNLYTLQTLLTCRLNPR